MIMTVVMVLFLPQTSIEAMDSQGNWGRKSNEEYHTQSIEGDPNVSVKKIERTVYKTVNKELREVVLILQSKLGMDSHTFKCIEDNKEYSQCKLAAMSSPLISGNNNKPLRDDLRSLLYKPWSDPFYGEHLTQKDFSLLEILRDAIAFQPSLDDQNKASLSLGKILELAPKRYINEDLGVNNSYQNLFLRRSLDEINKLFARCKMVQSSGVADLSSIPNLKQTQKDEIQMTLSKAYMMHMLDAEDQQSVANLEQFLCRWDGLNTKFDTYSQRRLLEIFGELDVVLKYEYSLQQQVNHCLSAADLKWLNDHKLNQKKIIEQPVRDITNDLKKDLETFLNRYDYLSFLPVYQERPLLQAQHHRILSTALTKESDTKNWVDLFTELSQLKVSLNSLGNEKLRSTMGITEKLSNLSPAGKAKWSELQTNVSRIKAKIETLQWQLLLSLQRENSISVDKVVAEIERKIEMKRLENEKHLNKSEIWILSMDGGGVRGKIAAEILRDLSYRLMERGNRRDLSDAFDLVAGTSVGGLIALALNLPDENGKVALDTDYISTLLETDKASIIFPSIHWIYKVLSQTNSNAYDEVSLENLLLANFGYTALSDIIIPTMVMAHSNRTQTPVEFNSWDETSEEITLMGGARSTTAASTYFSPKPQFYNGHLEEFVDGGLTANSPVHYALHGYLKMRKFNQDHSLKRINVISIGTGSTDYDYPHGTAETGVPGVITSLQEGTMGQVVRDAHEKTVQTLGGLMKDGIDVTYYHLNPDLDKPIELDSATEENIAKLRSLVYKSILESSFYEQLVAHLSGNQLITRNRHVEIKGKISDRSEEFFPSYPYLNSMIGNKEQKIII